MLFKSRGISGAVILEMINLLLPFSDSMKSNKTLGPAINITSIFFPFCLFAKRRQAD